MAYYEATGDFVVAELDDRIVGCGAVHVLWEDLAEIRTLAVTDEALGRGVGTAILDALVERGRGLGVRRLFCLTFETAFFERHGFEGDLTSALLALDQVSAWTSPMEFARRTALEVLLLERRG